MADIVDASTRSRMMSGIRSKDTRHEIEIRKRLFALGFRFRIHDSRLPGKPDIVLPRYKAIIFIHGCFWHAHDCILFKMPSTRTRFWAKKLSVNKGKDRLNIEALRLLGWRVLTIWECSFRGTGKNRDRELDKVINKTVRWLMSIKNRKEIKG